MTTQTYPFELPPLTFAPEALEPHFDARTTSIHHDEHHRIYVERLNDALTASFGSLKSFRLKFREAAAGHFASGWVFLVADARKSALEVLALPDHHCVLATYQTVLLVCDVWEHAYYLKHQQKRADYVDCWWQVANWQEAARRFGRPVEAAA